MAAHDQLKAISASISAGGIELACLERTIRRSLVPTQLELNDVSYLPVPTALLVDLATVHDVAMDAATAQRVLAQFFLNRVRNRGEALAWLGIDINEVVAAIKVWRPRLNTTWSSAIVETEMANGMVVLVDLTTRFLSGDGNGKRVACSVFVTTPDGAALYRQFGQLDERDGCVDLCKHVETEASLSVTTALDSAPLATAAELLRMLLEACPAGLAENHINDCRHDLREAFDRLVEVDDGGEAPRTVRVKAAVTEWRETP